MATPFLALITPLSGNYIDNTLPGPQPPFPPRPPTGPVDPGYSPPWARPPVDPGYSPPWARPRPPYIDNTLPGNLPYPDNSLPGSGLGTWGGGNVPMPSPPIYIPPEGTEPPLGIWGPTDPRPTPPIALPPGVTAPPPIPTHPIVLPPDLPPVIPPEGETPARPIDWKVAWTPATGWVVIGIPAEGTLVPTPSKRR